VVARRWQQRVEGPQVPGLVSGVTLLLGMWLVAVPFAWTYGATEGGFDARWNDVLTGLAVAAVGLVRLTRRVRLVTASALGVLLGGWLIIAPFLLDYGFGADSTRATVNDVLVGVTIAGLVILGFHHARNAVTPPS
jgi:peptidoglycan/LPS O-acetylase OafA/YrhL